MDEIIRWLNTVGRELLLHFLPTLLIVAIGILIIKIVGKIVNKALKKSHLEKAAHSLIRSVIKVTLSVLLALIAASSLGIDVTGIVALASVVSLALSLAMQNSLTNIIGGFTLLYTRPFSSGDYVEIAAQAGTVQEIGMAYTRLTTPDNKLISIPNSAVVSAEIVNYTVTGTRRLEVKITTAYTTPVEQVMAALKEAICVPDAMEDPAPFVAIAGYTDKGIEYTARIWCKSSVYWDNYFSINRRIKEIFDREGLQITYPHLNIHVEK